MGKANPSSKPRWGLALICVPIDILLLVGGFVAFYVGTPHWSQINTPAHNTQRTCASADHSDLCRTQHNRNERVRLVLVLFVDRLRADRGLV